MGFRVSCFVFLVSCVAFWFLGFRLWGKDWNLGFGVQKFEIRVQGPWIRVKQGRYQHRESCADFRVREASGFAHLNPRGWVLRFGDWGLRIGVWWLVFGI